MSRKRGSLNRRTDSFVRAVDRAEGSDLIIKIAGMTADPCLPRRMRLDAARYLSGALHGRIRLHHSAKAQIANNLAAEAAA